MLVKYLNENWTMKQVGTEEEYSTAVPTSVYNDLINNGILEDPYYRDNELKALKAVENDFSYSTVFEAGGIGECDRVLLVFEGIDTLADIYLNDSWLAAVNNMHRIWEFDIQEYLQPKNRLTVVLHSPTKFIREENEKNPILGQEDAMKGMAYLRKAHCMFGWDWGPRLPDEGIWKPVKLVGYNEARIDGVYVHQVHRDGRVGLFFDVDIDRIGQEHIRRFGRDEDRLRGLCLSGRLILPCGCERVLTHDDILNGIEIENPKLWWPNGLGNQPLYTIEIGLFGNVRDNRNAEDCGNDSACGTSEELPQGGCGTSEELPQGGCGTSEKLPQGGCGTSGELPQSACETSKKLPQGDCGTSEELPQSACGNGSRNFGADGKILLDTWSKRIGLRTMTMHREKDRFGESFYHEVNGKSVFAMGADYIPEDNILARTNRERTYNLLRQAKNANHNSVRVWGGGHYPEDWFYDACDELGLMVWQDFMFACAVYNLTEEFEENIKAEFVDNIKRIRNHASLGLWCGNNEMEMFVMQGTWVNRHSQKSDYIKMYEYIIPKVLKEYDPDTFYWPASPSSGGAFDEPNAENRGDVHYWDVWHGSRPITEYRKFYFRYVSEFGFQSFPSLKTCESFTEPADRNIFSYVMEKHQRNSVANGKIMNYMEQTFLYPTSFDTVLYASQLLQAEAMRYGVEHFRRNRGRCMGAVVWQLNDCWPVASWSSIDYYGRWKALHYYEKRFFAPVMISCAEEGVLTQDTNPNAEPYEVKKSIQLNVANESLKDEELTVRWELRDAKADIVRCGEESIAVHAQTSVWLKREAMQDASLYDNYVSYSCLRGNETVSSGTVLFTAPKQFRFVDPELCVYADGDEIVVKANAYARSVEILNEDDTMLLDDNYFDMNAGEKRVKVVKGKPVGLKVRSVYDIR